MTRHNTQLTQHYTPQHNTLHTTHYTEQKYAFTGLSLLELPKKHTHTIIIPFVGKEEAAYRKLEQYFSNQYNACKESTSNGVRVYTVSALFRNVLNMSL